MWLLDFSGVAAFGAVVGFVRERGCALVSGTTGFSPEQLSELKQLGWKRTGNQCGKLFGGRCRVEARGSYSC